MEKATNRAEAEEKVELFFSFIVGRPVCWPGPVDQDDSLWNYSMTRVFEASSCLADLTSSSWVPQDCTRIYTSISQSFTNRPERLCGIAKWSVMSKLETFFRPGKACSELVLERRVKYDDHARWRVKNSRWCYWIATSMLRKTRCSIIILVSIFVVCNNFDTGNFNWIMCIELNVYWISCIIRIYITL